MTMESWKNHYWHSVPCMKARIEKIVEYAGTGKKILEVGCNEGFVSKAMMEAGNDVTPTDISDEMIEKAKVQFGLEVQKADALNLPFGDDSFDVVVAGEVLEHLTNPFKGLSELFRVAKERVIITLPIGEYWLGELTHFWELNASFIDHDSAEEIPAPKHILVLCWDRRRDDQLKDIPPFDTALHKKKHSIGG